MIQTIVVDLDKTLLRDDHTISDKTRQVLQNLLRAEKQCIIATARSFALTRQVVPTFLHHTYWICNNGGEIYHRGNRLQSWFMDTATVEAALDTLQKQQIAYAVAQSNQLFSPFDIRDFLNKMSLDSVQFTQCAPQNIPTVAVERILFALPEHATDLLAHLPPECKPIISFGFLGEIISSQASKLRALRWLEQNGKLDLHSTIAFGDDLSDSEMLTHCRIGVAMKNAVSEVKEAADIITTSNNRDGVYTILQLIEDSRRV